MRSKPAPRRKGPIPVRLPEALRVRLDEIASALMRKTGKAHSRHSVIVLAIEKGLPAVERSAR